MLELSSPDLNSAHQASTAEEGTQDRMEWRPVPAAFAVAWARAEDRLRRSSGMGGARRKPLRDSSAGGAVYPPAYSGAAGLRRAAQSPLVARLLARRQIEFESAGASQRSSPRRPRSVGSAPRRKTASTSLPLSLPGQ